jgi:hypothetical protein
MSEGPYTDQEKGAMPASELVSLHDALGGAIQLQHDTAAAWATQVTRNSGLTISPLGAYRTTAQSDSIGAYGQSHGYGTCVDIYNSTANQWAIDNFPAVWAQDLYHAGKPHNAANEWNHWHYTGTITTGAPGTGGPTEEQDEDVVYYYATSTSTNGWIGQGGIYIQGADGPLRGLGGDEWGARSYFGAQCAQWTGDMIDTLIQRVGLLQVNAQGQLAGLILYQP